MIRTALEAFLHSRWRGMHKRCTSVTPKVIEAYRARGITVCQAWRTFPPFLAYAIAELGIPDLTDGTRWTIDRINNDLGYFPGNVRWATYRENIRNRRNTVFVDFNGERILLVELAERIGLPYALLSDRIVRNKWSVERAATTPVVDQYRRSNSPSSNRLFFIHNGRSQSLAEWATELGFDIAKVRRRLAHGWTFERSVSTPYDRNGNAVATRRINHG